MIIEWLDTSCYYFIMSVLRHRVIATATTIRSEVRAAREAECHYSSHVCSFFKQQCVKNTAIRSTSVSVHYNHLLLLPLHCCHTILNPYVNESEACLTLWLFLIHCQTLFPDNGRDCVASVFKEAYNDVAPFKTVATSTSQRRGHEEQRKTPSSMSELQAQALASASGIGLR